MENFSQIMDPDYADMAYQNEENIGIGDILAPVDTNLTETQANNESFATIPSDGNSSTHIPEQIFEESSSAMVAPAVAAAQPNTTDETQTVPDAIENEKNTIDAIDSTETPQVEPVLSQTAMLDASANASPTEPAATNEAVVQNDDEKKDEDNGEKVAEQEENVAESSSLMVPDEKTKRQDAVEEEIDKNQCRICLAKDNLVDIYKFDEDKKLQICDLVTKLCPSLRINTRDYLPQFVCNACEDRLNKAYELKLQCEATDRELRTKLPRRKRKARSVTEFVMIDCNELSSGSEDDDDKDQDDDEFHLSEVVSSSSELDSEVSSEEEMKKRPPPKRARKQPPKPPPKRQTVAPVTYVYKTPTTSTKKPPGTIANIKVERIDADRTPVKRVQHFQCSICRKTFTDRTVFGSHVQKHREEKERTCGECRHLFASISELQKHIRIHHNKQRQAAPSNNNIKRRSDHEPSANGERDLFKTVAPLTTTYWSDSFSD